MDNKFKVRVECFTYNQSKFITDTLNGFCSQKTNFPYICIIVDDASTDNEHEVIHKYEDAFFANIYTKTVIDDDKPLAQISYCQHRTNENCYFAIIYLKKNLYTQNASYTKRDLMQEWIDNSVYTALCEGDDFWIDENKLQKQADFLDNNPDFSLVFGCANSLMQSENRIYPSSSIQEKELTFTSLMFTDAVTTCTSMFRTEFETKYISEVKQSWATGDYPLWLFMSKHGRVYRMGDLFATYRILESSASHHKDPMKALAFKLSSIDSTYYFIDKYGLDDETVYKYGEKEGNMLLHRAVSYQSYEFAKAALKFKRDKGIQITLKDRLIVFLLKPALFRYLIKVFLNARTYCKKNIFHNYTRQ